MTYHNSFKIKYKYQDLVQYKSKYLLDQCLTMDDVKVYDDLFVCILFFYHLGLLLSKSGIYSGERESDTQFLSA